MAPRIAASTTSIAPRRTRSRYAWASVGLSCTARSERARRCAQPWRPTSGSARGMSLASRSGRGGAPRLSHELSGRERARRNRIVQHRTDAHVLRTRHDLGPHGPGRRRRLPRRSVACRSASAASCSELDSPRTFASLAAKHHLEVTAARARADPARPAPPRRLPAPGRPAAAHRPAVLDGIARPSPPARLCHPTLAAVHGRRRARHCARAGGHVLGGGHDASSAKMQGWTTH